MTRSLRGIQTDAGNAIRKRRVELGLTQEEFAWRADLHRTYVADIERGARNFSLQSLSRMAGALETSAGVLLAGAAAPGTPEAQRAPSPKVPEIWLIEDDAADAALTARAFRRSRVRNPVRTFAAAEPALERLRLADEAGGGALPQLILLDLQLPRMSGLEFLRFLRQGPRTRAISVLVISGSRQGRTIVEASRLGIDHYILKPVTVAGLVELLPQLHLNLTIGRS